MNRYFLLIPAVFIGLFTANIAFSQDTTVVISADMFDELQIIHLGTLDGWVFRPGHDPAWADPDLDTSDWVAMKPSELTTDHADESGLIEGWFRLRFKLDSTFTEIPLAWRSGTFGAKGLYMDGEKEISFGTPNTNRRLHKSYHPWNKLSDPVHFEIEREYTLAFYLTDHHSALVDRFTLSEITVDPLLRLTGPEFTSYLYSLALTYRSFQVLWISVMFLLTFLFWIISFQSRREYLFRLIAWINTLFLITALSMFSGEFLEANLILERLFLLVFAVSALMIFGLIPMIVSQMLRRTISSRLKILFGVLILVGIFSHVTASNIPAVISLIFVIGITANYVQAAWGEIHASQWVVIGGLILNIVFVLIYLFYVMFAAEPTFLTFALLNTGIYLTFPISLLLFISIRYKEILTDIQNNAKEVVRLTSEKLESEKEKQRVAANQKKLLEQEVEKRTRELRESLESLNATQEQLVQQEKLASLGQLTAGIAHEIKNPLNFVNNFSDVSLELIEEAREEVRRVTEDGEPESRKEKTPLLRGESEGGTEARGVFEKAESESQSRNTDEDSSSNNTLLPSEASAQAGLNPLSRGKAGQSPKKNLILEILDDIEANLRKIHEHGSRADNIVRSMLLHSRGGSGEMESTDLNALVKEYVNLAFHGMRAGKDPISVDIDLQLGENIGEVPLIAEDFSRVILNLCNNAFDAMRTLGAERSAHDENYSPKLTVSTKSENGQILIEVQDNGPGIPDEIKDKILQPFFTTKKGTQGTGLGLSITNDIVKAHGGSMVVHSQPGKTVFSIMLSG